MKYKYEMRINTTSSIDALDAFAHETYQDIEAESLSEANKQAEIMARSLETGLLTAAELISGNVGKLKVAVVPKLIGVDKER